MLLFFVVVGVEKVAYFIKIKIEKKNNDDDITLLEKSVISYKIEQ